MAFDMLIGNDALRARLADDVRRATLSHAYIIEGAGGSGKKTLAQALCAALVCEHRDGVEFPCRTCLSCRKVFERNSPDVICIGRGDKASIGVDDVRFLRSDALVPPNDGENKVYVIQDADTMTDAAQNALLLTLEEPPPYVLFLLLCENAASLLETVRSRAVRLRMHLVPNDKLWAHLLKNDRSFSALSEGAFVFRFEREREKGDTLACRRKRGACTDTFRCQDPKAFAGPTSRCFGICFNGA